MAVEVSEVKNYIYDLLAGDATLQGLLGGAPNPRVYADQAPAGLTSEYVVFSTQSPGMDFNGLGTVRLMSQPLMRVVVTRKGQPNAAMRQIDARIDALLGGVRASTSGSHVISFQREMPVDRAYYDSANNRYHDIGALWRSYVRAS